MVTKEYGFVFRGEGVLARQWVERDINSLSPSYTRSYGFTISHGKGAEVWDVDGNRYIDFAAGIAVLSTGYSHPKVINSIKQQAEKYLHIGGTDFFCPQPVILAEKLQEIIPIHGAVNPNDKRVYFANSGTESVEAAIKLARFRQGRSHIIAFYGGFHGRTMGSLSVTASKATQRGGYPYIPGGVTHVPYPARNICDTCDEGASCCNQCWCDAVGFVEKFVFKKVPPTEVAAVIVEAVQGEGGYLVPRNDFFPRLREMCDKYGILLILDEVQSGIGRTGKWTAVEHWDVAPDITCLAKGIASGMPLGAIVTHKDVMDVWYPGVHASTFGGNPVSCAAAIATLEVIIEEDLLDHVMSIGEITLKRLKGFSSVHPSVTRVDGLGCMIGIDFYAPGGTPLPKFRDEIVDRCYLNGLLTLGCGSSGMRFSPPLVLSHELLNEGMDILEHAIASVEEDMWAEIVN